MTHTVAGLFDRRRSADLVVEHLVQEYGIPRESVRVFGAGGGGAAEARSPHDSDQEASLAELGLPEERVRAYAEGIGRGKIVVAAQVEGDRVERVLASYAEYGGAHVESCEAKWRNEASGE